ncbi:MAG: Hpt domain-containing protein [Lacipirellulaceae bacterium]
MPIDEMNSSANQHESTDPHDAPGGDEAPRGAIDLSVALRRFRGDVQLLLDMTSFYTDDHPALCDRLDAALDRGDWDELRRAAHTLRGMASTFDADDVTHLAATVESFAGRGDRQLLAPLVPRLTVNAKRLGASLAAWRAGATQG